MTIEDNHGYKFYKDILKSPKLIVAPMVDQSDLPFRELCKKYGADIGYTPMINSECFLRSAKVRKEYLYNCSSDRPLIAQFCCNKIDTFLKVVELSKDYCDAIDINLGCPQNIAKKGHYGSYLQDEWDLISSMIKQAIDKFQFPITCKIRVFEDEQRTIDYAKMIESSGCYLLTVHGRTRQMKGQFTGLADWKIIKRLKQELKIPVFANGNIQSMNDVKECFKFTGVDGIMAAEGLLYNPALFKSIHVPTWIIIDEYLNICKSTGIISNSFIKAHLFKIAHSTLHCEQFFDLRLQLMKSSCLDDFQNFSNDLRKRFEIKEEDQIIEQSTLPLPHYLTQPYFRPKSKDNSEEKNESTTSVTDDKECNLNKEIKKRKKSQNLESKRKKKLSDCLEAECFNPASLTCDYKLCKSCCKKKVFNKEDNSFKYSCKAHRFNIKKSNIIEDKKEINKEENLDDKDKEEIKN